MFGRNATASGSAADKPEHPPAASKQQSPEHFYHHRDEHNQTGQVELVWIDKKLSSLPPSLLAISALVVGSSATLLATWGYVRYFRRIPNADWVTPDMIKKKRWIKGYVTSVGDNDNFRLYHTPAIGWRWPIKFRHVPTKRDKLRENTIHIRIAGVDAPEGAHFGRPGQPFSQEALAWLKNQVEGKTVYCQLFRKDQYSRIVAMPYLKPRLLPNFLASGKSVSLEMLRAGWAVTYEQAGAEYGRWSKEEFQRVQAQAQASRVGMWVNGVSATESPAEYKRRYAGSTPVDSETMNGPSSKEQNGNEEMPWWRKLWFKA